MGVLLIRLLGGWLGFFVAHLIVNGWLFRGSVGEGTLAAGMMFCAGGWMVALGVYVMGIVVGILGIIPLINWTGTWLQRAAQSDSRLRRKKR